MVGPKIFLNKPLVLIAASINADHMYKGIILRVLRNTPIRTEEE